MAGGYHSSGYNWIQDSRNGDYFYIEEFPHLVVAKAPNYGECIPSDLWEAIVFEDASCRIILGRHEFCTQKEAHHCIEQFLEVSLKNAK